MAHLEAVLPATIPDENVEQIVKFMNKARRKVRISIKLAEEAASETQCIVVLKDSNACQMKGLQEGGMRKSLCGIFMGTKRFGQASSMANLRMPPIKDGRLPKLFNIILGARDSKTGLQDGDLYFIFDGMKHHNENMF